MRTRKLHKKRANQHWVIQLRKHAHMINRLEKNENSQYKKKK